MDLSEIPQSLLRKVHDRAAANMNAGTATGGAGALNTESVREGIASQITAQAAQEDHVVLSDDASSTIAQALAKALAPYQGDDHDHDGHDNGNNDGPDTADWDNLYASASAADYTPAAPPPVSFNSFDASNPIAADATTTDDGVQYSDLAVGDGADTVGVGGAGANGITVSFNAWTDMGQPIAHEDNKAVTLGQGSLPADLEKAIAGMKAGSQRRIAIDDPHRPGHKLYYDVQLNAVAPPPPPPPPPPPTITFNTFDPSTVLPNDAVTMANGIKYYDYNTGQGAPAADHEDVTVNYTGWLLDGTKFDSSYDAGQPFQFTLGVGQVIPGWDQAVKGMQLGQRRRIEIPASLAYGATGAGPDIPPNATLVFDVELDGRTPNEVPSTTARPVPTDGLIAPKAEMTVYDVIGNMGGEDALTAFLQGEGANDLAAKMSDGSVTLADVTAAQQANPNLFKDATQALRFNQGKDSVQSFLHDTAKMSDNDTAYALWLMGYTADPPVTTNTDPNAITTGFGYRKFDPNNIIPADAPTSPDGIQYYDFKPGNGDPGARDGEDVTINYTVWLTDGTLEDSSVERGQPITMTLGKGQTIPGMEEALYGMAPGQERRIVVPPELAYGDAGTGPIPPGAHLVIDLQMLARTPNPVASTNGDRPIPADGVVSSNGMTIYDIVGQMGGGGTLLQLLNYEGATTLAQKYQAGTVTSQDISDAQTAYPTLFNDAGTILRYHTDANAMGNFLATTGGVTNNSDIGYSLWLMGFLGSPTG